MFDNYCHNFFTRCYSGWCVFISMIAIVDVVTTTQTYIIINIGSRLIQTTNLQAMGWVSVDVKTVLPCTKPMICCRGIYSTNGEYRYHPQPKMPTGNRTSEITATSYGRLLKSHCFETRNSKVSVSPLTRNDTTLEESRLKLTRLTTV